MFIKAGSIENPFFIHSAGIFKPSEVETVSDNVVRCIDHRGNIPEVRYQTRDGKVYISGYQVNSERFHIQFIHNEERNKRKAFNLVEVFHRTLQDLEEKGFKNISIHCQPKLVSIAIRRYGFQTYDGKSLADIMKGNKGIRTIPLVKKF